MQRSSPHSPPVTWLSRGFVLMGGLALLRLVSLAPKAAAPGTQEERDRTEALGRGAPAEPASPQARAAGHETQDVDARLLALLIVGLGGAVAGVIGLMVVLLHGLEARRNAAQPAFTAQQTALVTPPLPHLQADPQEELARFLAAEEARLSDYAWADPAHTRARIPIARAMTLTIGHGLEPRP